jgi:hypothetical protein
LNAERKSRYCFLKSNDEQQNLKTENILLIGVIIWQAGPDENGAI